MQTMQNLPPLSGPTEKGNASEDKAARPSERVLPLCLRIRRLCASGLSGNELGLALDVDASGYGLGDDASLEVAYGSVGILFGIALHCLYARGLAVGTELHVFASQYGHMQLV